VIAQGDPNECGVRDEFLSNPTSRNLSPYDQRAAQRSAPMLASTTPVILTFNEAPNIARTLGKLGWARDIVVVDSGSTDETIAICKATPNVRLFHRSFDEHASQWNFAIHETNIVSEWVLALDADYVLSDGLVDELIALKPSAGIDGYDARFRYCVFGRALSGSLYPPVTVLFRRQHGRYKKDGHTQRLTVAGTVSSLASEIFHDDRKPFSRWLSSQDRYATLECGLLAETQMRHLRWKDKIRKMILLAPLMTPVYCLIVKRGLLDGWAGLYYAAQRTIAELILSAKLIERLLQKRGTAEK